MEDKEQENELKERITRSLIEQGFLSRDLVRISQKDSEKCWLRKLHSTAVEHKRQRSGKYLRRAERRLLSQFANGFEVYPNFISPRLVEVTANSEEELVFRYASLHWSIPTSSGYGRRIRFLVVDEHTEKVMGLIGIGDPVFSLGSRDKWIGWDKEAKRENLRHVMDFYVLGAVPPYSQLLCGKLIALLATSDEVREALKRKYSGTDSFILGRPSDARIALFTTTSALGRSSVYNRVKYENELAFISTGFTRGYGELQFSNGLYSAISDYAFDHLNPTAKQSNWGNGFRNRREVIRKCLSQLQLPGEWLNHGIEREVFAIPLGKNCKEFLKGEESELQEHSRSASALFDFFRERWLIPRSKRNLRYLDWYSKHWILWEG